METNFLAALNDNARLSGRIIELLINEGGAMNTNAIHKKVKKSGATVTYQAVHKTLNKMVENKVLVRKDKEYLINLEWALELEKFSKNMKQICFSRQPIQLEGLESFKELDNVRVFEFDSPGNAELFRKQLQIEYLENTNDQRPYVSQTSHMKSPLAFSENALKIVSAIDKHRKPCYMIISNNSPIDRWCANYYKRDLIKIKMGVCTSAPTDIMVLGDEVIEIYTPEKVNKVIDETYRNREIKDLNVIKFYQDIYQKKALTKVRIIKDPAIAEQIRNNVLSHFTKEDLKETGKTASCLILFSEGKNKVLCVRRRNTRKWSDTIMFGSAEQQEKGETPKDALLRGIEEELQVDPKKVKNVNFVGDVKPNEIFEIFGVTAKFFTAETDKETMSEIIDNINSDKSYELTNAYLVNSEEIGLMPNVQPSYMEIIKKLPIKKIQEITV